MKVRLLHDVFMGEPVMDSLFRLSRDGRSWIAAEAALAQAELAADGKRLVTILVLAAFIIGNIVAAVMLVAAAIVALVEPYVGGLANAAGLVALVYFLLAAGCSWWVSHLSRSRLGITSVLKRWGQMAMQGTASDHDKA